MRHVKRAARADLHRFKAFIEMNELETGAWRGMIEDGELIEAHDDAYDEGRDYSDLSAGGRRAGARRRRRGRRRNSRAEGTTSSGRGAPARDPGNALPIGRPEQRSESVRLAGSRSSG